MELLEADYHWITRQILDLASDSAQGRMVSILEGGYDLDALSRSARAHAEALVTAGRD
jgi:acetoin utilization deacetylase AcuC-like enzyme